MADEQSIGNSRKPWDISFLSSLHSLSHSPSDKLCVLLTTGALSPIHLGHVRMMEHAKAYLEIHGYSVLAGYISPSHDRYVGPKAMHFKTPFVDSSHRIAMASQAIQGIDWLHIGEWESHYEEDWPDYPVVLYSLFLAIKSHFTDTSIDVFYVCGSDHARYCKNGFGHPHLGLVVVPRNRECDVTKSESKKVFVTTPLKSIEGISSTKIREVLTGPHPEGALSLLHASVFQHIVTNRLYHVTLTPCEQPKHIFISSHALFRQWNEIKDRRDVLQESLFFFGSKSSWLFPKSIDEEREAVMESPEYAAMWRCNSFMQYIYARYLMGDVHFLKRKDLPCCEGRHERDPNAFVLASDWIARKGLRPLILDDQLWLSQRDTATFRFTSNVDSVIENYHNGEHDLTSTMELLFQSNPSVIPQIFFQ